MMRIVVGKLAKCGVTDADEREVKGVECCSEVK